MLSSVGVVSVYDLGELKRYALMFDRLFISNPWDRVYFPGGPNTRRFSTFTGEPSTDVDMTWLQTQGLILDYELNISESLRKDPLYQKHANEAIRILTQSTKEPIENAVEVFEGWAERFSSRDDAHLAFGASIA